MGAAALGLDLQEFPHPIPGSPSQGSGALGNTTSKQRSQKETEKAPIESGSSSKPLFARPQKGARASATGDVMEIKKTQPGSWPSVKITVIRIASIY